MTNMIDPTIKERKINRRYKKYLRFEIKELDAYSLGERIKQQRTAKGFTREYVALQIGLSRSYIADIEYGTKITTIKNLYSMSKLLDLSLHHILTGCPCPGITCEEARFLQIVRNASYALRGCTPSQIKSMECIVRACADTYPYAYRYSSPVESTFRINQLLSINLNAFPNKESKAAYPPNWLLLGSGDSALEKQDLTLDLCAMAGRIKERRLALNFTRGDIAEYLDICESYVASLEYGIKCLSLPKFHTLLQVLHTTADYITGAIQSWPIYFPDADSLECVSNICNIIFASTQKDAEYIFDMIKDYVAIVHDR